MKELSNITIIILCRMNQVYLEKPQKGKQSSTATVGSRRQEMLVKLREEALLGRNSQESLERGEEDIF